MFKIRKFPLMGEVFALDRFGGLDPASFIREENTGPVGLFDQGQAIPVPGQTSVLVYECMDFHS